jgi:nitroimidazol reductase NimA-like FMN-containing flavoprotein (pyridoxamine 5'-phosphate oxidase superfamily)
MRRSELKLSTDQALSILKHNSHGVLSLVLPDGTPYGVPLNYGYFDHKIIMHAALTGLKLDAISVHPHACFTVIHKAEVDIAHLSTLYASVIAFGKVELITEPIKKHHLLTQMLNHYGVSESMAAHALKVDAPQTVVLLLTIDELTAKGYSQALEDI